MANVPAGPVAPEPSTEMFAAVTTGAARAGEPKPNRKTKAPLAASAKRSFAMPRPMAGRQASAPACVPDEDPLVELFDLPPDDSVFASVSFSVFESESFVVLLVEVLSLSLIESDTVVDELSFISTRFVAS